MKIVFLGGGKMAEAIVTGLLRDGVCEAKQVVVCEIVEERRAYLAATLDVVVVDAVAEAVREADVVFLAVKPQVLGSVLVEAATVVPPQALLISIAAGKTLDQIAASFDTAKVVRVMPNLAASVGASMNVFCCNAHVQAEDRALVVRLLAAFGEVVEADESLFDAVTAVSGSGPAFVAYLLAALAAAGVALGLSEGQAYTLALQTFLGTAQVLQAQGGTPQALIESVSSPNGTTVAGMQVLGASDVRAVLAETVAAAAARSQALRESAEA
ncbi:MAG: pyrroline-5-carboxylate reductase [Candidatus Promineifilaceae bacterium]|jgi:pyrroline-5-carboxylate reductase